VAEATISYSSVTKVKPSRQKMETSPPAAQETTNCTEPPLTRYCSAAPVTTSSKGMVATITSTVEQETMSCMETKAKTRFTAAQAKTRLPRAATTTLCTEAMEMMISKQELVRTMSAATPAMIKFTGRQVTTTSGAEVATTPYEAVSELTFSGVEREMTSC